MTGHNAVLTDFNDMAQVEGLDAVRDAIHAALADDGWDEPLPIPNQLKAVEPFDYELLPDSLRPWVLDVCERMQCPADFVAVGVVVSLSSVIGRKAVILPKRRDDWTVVPNLWGCVVGRPGVMKSPALAEVLKPVNRLEAMADADHRIALEEHEVQEKATALMAKAAEKKAEKAAQKPNANAREVADLLRQAAGAELEPPQMRRYIVNDATVEALGEVLIGNPWGVLAYRDELHGLLKSLDREGQEGARAFYLQGYDGNQAYTFDRIGRGKNKRIDAVCISLLGGIQPGKLQTYVRDAVSGGTGDDGLLQRFGLLVWPDIDGKWMNIDRQPDHHAREKAFEIFRRLDAIRPATNEDGKEVPAILRFDPAAQDIFEEWRLKFENDLRAGQEHPALESHLSKYRKLVPALSLVLGLADGCTQTIDPPAIGRALAWYEYLKSHAERVYSAGIRPDTEAPLALLKKITSGALEDGFKVRDVYRREWTHLNSREAVQTAASMLCDLGYLKAFAEQDTSGGRPTVAFRINPRINRG